MENNFKCKACGEEFFESTYTMGYVSSGEIIYRNRFKQKIICPKCKSEDVENIPKENVGVPYFAKFNTMSSGEKRDLLKKRANAHLSKNKDEHRSINERFNKKLMGGS